MPTIYYQGNNLPPPLSKTRIWNICEILEKNKTPKKNIAQISGKNKTPRAKRAKKIWGFLGVLQGGNAQKGVQKGSKKCHKIDEIFWKK